MNLQITKTDQIVELDGVECRLWEGITFKDGIRCKVFVHLISVHNDSDQEQFENALRKEPHPKKLTPNVLQANAPKLKLITSAPLRTGDWVAIGVDGRLEPLDTSDPDQGALVATAAEDIEQGALVYMELGKLRNMSRDVEIPTVHPEHIQTVLETDADIANDVWKEMTDVHLGIKFSVGTGSGGTRRVHWRQTLSRKELEQAVAPAAVLELWLDEWEKVAQDLRDSERGRL